VAAAPVTMATDEDALATILFSGDTSDVTKPVPEIFQNTVVEATGTVAGIVGTATFTNAMGAVVIRITY